MCISVRLHRLILARVPATHESRRLFLTLNKHFRNLILLRIASLPIKEALQHQFLIL